MVRDFLLEMFATPSPSSQLDKYGVVGDMSDFHFVSKPFTYALSLDQLGAEVVQKYIGREPSGRTFNEIAVDYNGLAVQNIVLEISFCHVFQASLTTL